MSSTQTTRADDHDQWREKIMSALKELRGDDARHGHLRDNASDEASGSCSSAGE